MRLGEQNHNLTSCVSQVREQISGREAAMRTQLGLPRTPRLCLY